LNSTIFSSKKGVEGGRVSRNGGERGGNRNEIVTGNNSILEAALTNLCRNKHLLGEKNERKRKNRGGAPRRRGSTVLTQEGLGKFWGEGGKGGKTGERQFLKVDR